MTRSKVLVLGISTAVAIALVVFSVRAFLSASPEVKADLGDPTIIATAGLTQATGPIELTFRPIVEAPKRASRENAFPVTVDMNLVRARYLSNPDSSIDAEALDQLRTNLRDALQLRLSLAGAQVSADGWQSAGADVEFRWSVSVLSPGTHDGTIDKKIVDGQFTVPRTSDQIPIRIIVGSIIDEWRDAGGLIAGVSGRKSTRLNSSH